MKNQFLETCKNLALASVSAAVVYGLWLTLLGISVMPMPPLYASLLPASLVVAICVMGVGFGIFLQGIYLAVFHWEK